MNERNQIEIKELYESLNSLLSLRTIDGYIQIANIFGNMSLEQLNTVTDIAYMINATNIFLAELNANSKKVIFEGKKTIREVVNCLIELRFCLWEIEFVGEDTSFERFDNFVKVNNISIYAVIQTIQNTSNEKGRIAYILSQFYKGKRLAFEYKLLLYCNEVNSDAREVLERLSEIYIELGKNNLAQSCLSQIEGRLQFKDDDKSDPEKYRKLLVKKHAGEKVDFIMCANDELYMREAISYIERLYVPDGMSIEVLTIAEAKSMASGYNEGMRVSNAKYKVYLHQDVFIVDRFFLYQLISCFENSEIGMVGMVGSPKLPDSKIMWKGDRVGWIYCSDPYEFADWNIGEIDNVYEEVEAVDGLLIATQYDIDWREDIFDKWDFYDISQSFEMRRKNYKVVVPHVDRPLVLHDDGFMNLGNYYGELEKFSREYFQEDIMYEKL